MYIVYVYESTWLQTNLEPVFAFKNHHRNTNRTQTLANRFLNG